MVGGRGGRDAEGCHRGRAEVTGTMRPCQSGAPQAAAVKGPGMAATAGGTGLADGASSRVVIWFSVLAAGSTTGGAGSAAAGLAVVGGAGIGPGRTGLDRAGRHHGEVIVVAVVVDAGSEVAVVVGRLMGCGAAWARPGRHHGADASATGAGLRSWDEPQAADGACRWFIA